MSDLVNREDMIRLVCSEEYSKRMDGQMLGAVVASLLDTPKVIDSDIVREGHWISDDKGYFRCSVCNQKPKDQTAMTDYCPHCGARLKIRKDK